MVEMICEFCMWVGPVNIGETDCPHCGEKNTLLPSSYSEELEKLEPVIKEENTENNCVSDIQE